MKFKLVENLDSIELNESGLSRIFTHLKDDVDFAIIGTRDKDTHRDRSNELSFDLGSLKNKLNNDGINIGWKELVGRYTYENGDVDDETSYIIYNIPKKDALKLAKGINQETIIWKDKDFFGFLDMDGNQKWDELGREMNFSSDDVKSFGSALSTYGHKRDSKHNKGVPFIFEVLSVDRERENNSTKIKKTYTSLFKENK